jgi:hypothetical protein
VVGIPFELSRSSILFDATAPNSPLESALGVFSPRAIKPDMVSKSKVRQTMWRDMFRYRG